MIARPDRVFIRARNPDRRTLCRVLDRRFSLAFAMTFPRVHKSLTSMNRHSIPESLRAIKSGRLAG